MRCVRDLSVCVTYVHLYSLYLSFSLGQLAEDVVRWSESSQPNSAPSSLPPPSPSHSSTSSLSSEDSAHVNTSDTPANHLPHPAMTPNPIGTTNGPKIGTLPPPPQALVTVAQPTLLNGHVRYDSIDEQAIVEDDVPVPFCDCPPDPEIPRHIILHQLRFVCVVTLFHTLTHSHTHTLTHTHHTQCERCIEVSIGVRPTNHPHCTRYGLP